MRSWALLALGLAVGLDVPSNVDGASTPLPAPRTDFYIPSNITYFNPATLGPTPRIVIEKVNADTVWLESNPANHYFGGFDGETPDTTLMDNVRTATANFFGCDLSELAIMPSTTVAFNTVATGLVESGFLTDGDIVLTSDHEHAGGLMGWLHYQTLGLIQVQPVHLPTSALSATVTEIVKSFESAIVPGKTKVISVSHVLTTNGLRVPIKEISAMAHEHGIVVVVDGAQAPGGIAVNVTDLGCDIYAASCHKWMLAPKGNGVVFVSSDVQSKINATFFDEGFRVYTGATGTRPAATILGLGHAIDYLNNFTDGAVGIETHNMALRETAWQALVTANVTDLEILSAPAASNMASPIITLKLPANVSERDVASKMYQDHGMVVKQAADFPDPQPAAIRLGFHLYNSEADVQSLISALTAVVQELTPSAAPQPR